MPPIPSNIRGNADLTENEMETKCFFEKITIKNLTALYLGNKEALKEIFVLTPLGFVIL